MNGLEYHLHIAHNRLKYEALNIKPIYVTSL
jgi:hypothetical protein